MSRREDENGQVAYCPACGERIYFRKPPKRGNHITCRECESLLNVVRLSPIQLTWAFEDPLGNGRPSYRNYVDEADTEYEDYADLEYSDDDDYPYADED